ncbi:MAG: hypothetical protein QOD85_1199, partial [Gaiellaceae bacterium]|nr:hypothetical protein [Gaiellaceae bacterium]
MSLNAIAEEVEASVSSVSRWVRDVQLSDEQRSLLEMRAVTGQIKGSAVNAAVR